MAANANASAFGGAGGAGFFPRESAILRQPKRDTREMEQALVATYRQTRIANRSTREMEEQMVAQFRAASAAIPDLANDYNNNTPPPQPPAPVAAPAGTSAGVTTTRNMQAESFYYEKSINEPSAVPAPLRTSQNQGSSLPYPNSTYDMYQEVGQGPYRESINIGFQPYNPDSYYQPQQLQTQQAQAMVYQAQQYYPGQQQYQPQPGGLPRAERGSDGRYVG